MFAATNNAAIPAPANSPMPISQFRFRWFTLLQKKQVTRQWAQLQWVCRGRAERKPLCGVCRRGRNFLRMLARAPNAKIRQFAELGEGGKCKIRRDLSVAPAPDRLLYLLPTSAKIRAGPPVPFSILIGATMSEAPAGGRLPRCATFSR